MSLLVLLGDGQHKAPPHPQPILITHTLRMAELIEFGHYCLIPPSRAPSVDHPLQTHFYVGLLTVLLLERSEHFLLRCFYLGTFSSRVCVLLCMSEGCTS